MDEIIIIRTFDSDGSSFKRIMDALHGSNIHMTEITSPVLTFGEIEIHPASRRVLRAGREIRLNHSEYSILHCMAKSLGRVYTKEQLYSAAWGEEYLHGTNSVENIIWRLRQKLEEDPKHPTYIKTVIRGGYKIGKSP